MTPDQTRQCVEIVREMASTAPAGITPIDQVFLTEKQRELLWRSVHLLRPRSAAEAVIEAAIAYTRMRMAQAATDLCNAVVRYQRERGDK